MIRLEGSGILKGKAIGSIIFYLLGEKSITNQQSQI